MQIKLEYVPISKSGAFYPLPTVFSVQDEASTLWFIGAWLVFGVSLRIRPAITEETLEEILTKRCKDLARAVEVMSCELISIGTELEEFQQSQQSEEEQS